MDRVQFRDTAACSNQPSTLRACGWPYGLAGPGQAGQDGDGQAVWLHENLERQADRSKAGLMLLRKRYHIGIQEPGTPHAWNAASTNDLQPSTPSRLPSARCCRRKCWTLLQQQVPAMGTATLYRNLKALEDGGVRSAGTRLRKTSSISPASGVSAVTMRAPAARSRATAASKQRSAGSSSWSMKCNGGTAKAPQPSGAWGRTSGRSAPPPPTAPAT